MSLVSRNDLLPYDSDSVPEVRYLLHTKGKTAYIIRVQSLQCEEKLKPDSFSKVEGQISIIYYALYRPLYT